MKTSKYSTIINSIAWQQLRNNEAKYIKEQFRLFAADEMQNGNVTASIVDLYNKTYQMNDKGFIEYIESKTPQKYIVAAYNNYL